MPMAGAGLFGVPRFGWPAPVMTLIFHLIFGIVLGWVFGALVDRREQPVRTAGASIRLEDRA